MEADDPPFYSDVLGCARPRRDEHVVKADEYNALIYEIVDHVTTALTAVGSLSLRSVISGIGQVPRDLASRSMATALVALEEWRLALREGLGSSGNNGVLSLEPFTDHVMDHMARLPAIPHPTARSSNHSVDPT
jgi:hypothetical protein